MFLLGHMCWAYVTGRLCSKAVRVPVNPYLLLLVGALPDIDTIFVAVGIEHRTITHSLLFWITLFMPIFIKYRKASIPYFIAAVQHLVMGDLIVGSTRFLWPLSSTKFGLGFSLVSLENIAIEIAGLVIFLIIVRFSGDMKLLFTTLKGNVLSIGPLIPVVIFLLFIAANTVYISEHILEETRIDLSSKVEARILSSTFLPVIAAGHLTLASFLVISLTQGIRAVYRPRL
ncbi:MAG: metal-dependent hydrolase [Nitrososphaerales archaeon]